MLQPNPGRAGGSAKRAARPRAWLRGRGTAPLTRRRAVRHLRWCRTKSASQAAAVRPTHTEPVASLSLGDSGHRRDLALRLPGGVGGDPWGSVGILADGDRDGGAGPVVAPPPPGSSASSGCDPRGALSDPLRSGHRALARFTPPTPAADATLPANSAPLWIGLAALIFLPELRRSSLVWHDHVGRRCRSVLSTNPLWSSVSGRGTHEIGLPFPTVSPPGIEQD